MPSRRRFLGLAAAIAAPALLARRARGATWPAKPVRIVVPFTPGGSTDITARLVGKKLEDIWGQSVVIENKGGAGGNIAADGMGLAPSPQASVQGANSSSPPRADLLGRGLFSGVSGRDQTAVALSQPKRIGKPSPPSSVVVS